METKAERLLTWLLAGSCLLTAAVQQTVRLQPRFVPLSVEQQDLQVSVAGAVQQPGVYRLEWGATVEDLIRAAGGLAGDAAPELVAMARPLAQGDSIFVPQRGTPAGEERVSLNSADSWTLQRLPGVGPALAGRIIAGRPYNSVGDLLEVSGIGPATFGRLEPLVRP